LDNTYSVLNTSFVRLFSAYFSFYQGKLLHVNEDVMHMTEITFWLLVFFSLSNVININHDLLNLLQLNFHVVLYYYWSHSMSSLKDKMCLKLDFSLWWHSLSLFNSIYLQYHSIFLLMVIIIISFLSLFKSINKNLLHEQKSFLDLIVCMKSYIHPFTYA
jgi:hypothetical protein